MAAIDDAFLRLRRLWSASRHRTLEVGSPRPVELSSLLVIETCARRREQGKEANISDVAELADVAPSTASRLVDVAEQAGLLHREPSSQSRRFTALVLTSSGEQLRAQAVAARTGWLGTNSPPGIRLTSTNFGRLLLRFADQIGSRQPAEIRTARTAFDRLNGTDPKTAAAAGTKTSPST